MSAPMPVHAVQSPTARPLSAPNVARRSARLFVASSAPKMPWSTRPEMSSAVFGAMPHSAEATAKPTTPPTKSGRRPNRSPSAPATMYSEATASE